MAYTYELEDGSTVELSEGDEVRDTVEGRTMVVDELDDSGVVVWDDEGLGRSETPLSVEGNFSRGEYEKV